MADQLKISHVHLCNIETGAADMSLKLLASINELFGTDVYVQAYYAKNTEG